MDDANEHKLVVKALTDGLSNCVEWDPRSAKNARDDPANRDLTPKLIQDSVVAYVKKHGGSVVKQVVERRPLWVEQGHRFYYKVILPVKDFKHGLFVEMRLTDDDADFPIVQIVGAHPQRK